MSRYLFVVPPLVGHINPTLAVAEQLERRGHEVAWAGHGRALGSLLAPGSRVYRASDDELDAELVNLRSAWQELKGVVALKFFWQEFVLPLGRAMLPGVEGAIADFHPDVLIADQQALAGPVAARRAGVPWVTSATTSAELARSLRNLPKVEEWIRQLQNEFQRDAGLTEPVDLRFSDRLVLCFTTTDLVGSDMTFPDHYAFTGPAITTRPPTGDFPWERLDSDRRGVLVSLGSLNGESGTRFFGLAAEALGDLAQLIMVAPAGTVDHPPAGSIIAEWVPQLELLAPRRRGGVPCRAQHGRRGAGPRVAPGGGADTGRPAGGGPADRGRRGGHPGAVQPAPGPRAARRGECGARRPLLPPGGGAHQPVVRPGRGRGDGGRPSGSVGGVIPVPTGDMADAVDLAFRSDADPELRLTAFLYEQVFGHKATLMTFGAGGLTLFGRLEDRFALAMPVKWGATVAAATRSDGMIELRSGSQAGKELVRPVDSLDDLPDWAACPLAVVSAARAAGHPLGGMSLLVGTALPEGAGMQAEIALTAVVGVRPRPVVRGRADTGRTGAAGRPRRPTGRLHRPRRHGPAGRPAGDDGGAGAVRPGRGRAAAHDHRPRARR